MSDTVTVDEESGGWAVRYRRFLALTSTRDEAVLIASDLIEALARSGRSAELEIASLVTATLVAPRD